MSKIRKPVIDAVEEALTGAKVARAVAQDAKPLRGVLSPVTAKPSRVPVSSVSPLADVRGTTPAVRAQNETVEKILSKEQIQRVADALQKQKELNAQGIVVQMTDLGVSNADVLAFRTAVGMTGNRDALIKPYNRFMESVDRSGMVTENTMPLGNAEELRKLIGMEAGHGLTDTSAPILFTNKDGKPVYVATGVGYNAKLDGWGNAKGARPTHPLSTVYMQGTETRPIEMMVREDGSFVPSNLRNLQAENQIDIPVGKLDTRGLDFPTYTTDDYLEKAREAVGKKGEKLFAKALLMKTDTAEWKKQFNSKDLEDFRKALSGGNLDALNEMFQKNRKFRKLFASTFGQSDTTSVFGIPHYNSYANAMFSDPVKRTQFGGTAQLVLRPLNEGVDVSTMSPDIRFEYQWHTPTSTEANLYGENVPRSLMYQTGVQDTQRLFTDKNGNPLSGTMAQNKLLDSVDTQQQRILKSVDIENAIRFSQLWKKATSGQGLTKAESDELLQLDSLRRYNY